MLLTAIFILLTQTFGIITAAVFPALPAYVSTYFDLLVQYINQGMAWVAVFLDIPYISTLFGWWIQLGASILAIEIFVWIWSVVTGNVHSTYNSESTTFNADGEVIRTTSSSGSRHTRRFRR